MEMKQKVQQLKTILSTVLIASLLLYCFFITAPKAFSLCQEDGTCFEKALLTCEEVNYQEKSFPHSMNQYEIVGKTEKNCIVKFQLIDLGGAYSAGFIASEIECPVPKGIKISQLGLFFRHMGGTQCDNPENYLKYGQ